MEIPARLRLRVMTAITVSQLCWCGAIVIGFVNSASRH